MMIATATEVKQNFGYYMDYLQEHPDEEVNIMKYGNAVVKLVPAPEAVVKKKWEPKEGVDFYYKNGVKYTITHNPFEEEIKRRAAERNSEWPAGRSWKEQRDIWKMEDFENGKY